MLSSDVILNFNLELHKGEVMFGFQFFSFLTRLKNGSCVNLSLGFFPKPVCGFTVRQLQKSFIMQIANFMS